LVTPVAVILVLTGCQSVTVSSVREPVPPARIERVLIIASGMQQRQLLSSARFDGQIQQAFKDAGIATRLVFAEGIRDEAVVRAAFINKVAAPIANKMFECGLIP